MIMKEYSGASKWYLVLCVLFTVTGFIMLIWPHLTLSLLGLVLGIAMLVLGIAHIILYFTKDNSGAVLQMDLTEGVIFASFGAFMLMHMEFVNMALPFGTGILLLIGGITKIQYALDMKRVYFSRWTVMLGFAAVLILLGVLLLYNPFKEAVMIRFIGASLILDGVLSLISILMLSHRRKQIVKGKLPQKVLTRIGGGGEVVEEVQPQQTMPAAQAGEAWHEAKNGAEETE